jgi:hypothetical protein
MVGVVLTPGGANDCRRSHLLTAGAAAKPTTLFWRQPEGKLFHRFSRFSIFCTHLTSPLLWFTTLLMLLCVKKTIFAVDFYNI